MAYITLSMSCVYWTCLDLKKLDDTNRSLNESNVELERFAMIAAHDLQDPLRQNAVMLRMGREGNDSFLGDVESNNKRMIEFVKCLLNFARSGGNLKLVMSPVGEIVSDVRSILSMSLESSECELCVGEMPSLVCDPVQLGRVFLNLIKNSVRYHSALRELVVSVRAFHEKGFWVFEVTDNGQGISSRDIPMLFTAYRGRKMDSSGVGLGLAICKRVVEAHGGAISVVSVEGEGSTFRFTIADDLKPSE
jgi:signal transduction histidine kinase